VGAVGVAVLILFSLCVPVGLGAWSNTSTTGVWGVKSESHWNSGVGNEPDGNDKSFVYQWTNVTLDASWSFAFQSYVYVTGLEWWQYASFGQNECTHRVTFELTKDSDAVRIRFEHYGQRTWAVPLIHFVWDFYKKVDGEWVEFFSGQNMALEFWKRQEVSFRFYFFKQSDTVCRFTLVALTDKDSDVRVGDEVSVDFAVGSGFWSGLTLTQTVEKVGKGRVEGWKDSEDFTLTSTFEEQAGEYYWLMNIFEALTRPLYELLPDWLQDFVDSIVGIFGPLTPLLGTLFGLVQTIIPLLPVVLFVWVIDAGVSSVAKGSFEPLGVCFSTIFNVTSTIGHWLVSAAHAIYAVIHFW
jgi:hypothetical protein